MVVRRFVRYAAMVLACAWAFSVLVVGADMLAVWAGQLNGHGLADVVYVPMSRRLVLLATFAVTPPLAVLLLWHIGLRVVCSAHSWYRGTGTA